MSTLTIIFIVLKLVDVITWSWFWVLFPTILDVAFVIIVNLIALLFFKNDKWR